MLFKKANNVKLYQLDIRPWTKQNIFFLYFIFNKIFIITEAKVCIVNLHNVMRKLKPES